MLHTQKPIGEKERKIFELTEAGRQLCTDLFKRFAELISIAIELILYVCAPADAKSMKAPIEKILMDQKWLSGISIVINPTKNLRNWLKS